MGMEDALGLVMTEKIRDGRHRLALYSEKLSGLSPLKPLERGYALVSTEDGKDIHSVGDISEGQRLNIRLADGWMETEVIKAHIKGVGADGKR